MRYYEANGLISARRTSAGWRDFPSDTVDRVVTIQHLFAAGLTSRSISDILPCFDAPPTERASYLRQALDAQVERLVRERHRIDEELEIPRELQRDTSEGIGS